MPESDANSNPVKRCFVIMGFGIKTDFATGRKLDLNKSYKLLIKPVVESKGLICIRADEILHSGSIDYQMYKELLQADIVIADLSTANVNAFYELGIRHALRRRTTIVISEDKLSYPFDLNHIKITSYTHLGEAIDYEEVERFRQVLGDTIEAVLNIEDPDSPIYSHLHDLNPPFLEEAKPSPKPRKIWNILYKPKPAPAALNIVSAESFHDPADPTLAELVEKGEESLHDRQYANAKDLFMAALKMMKDDAINNPYLIQRLAYATYKTKLPDPVNALNDAIKLLSRLDLDHTNDTETVSLAGRIEKKLHHLGQGDEHLANAVQFYERGFFLLHNRYHGINLAFLYNKRADSSLSVTKEDKIADMIWAGRIRKKVLKMCDADWKDITERKDRMEMKAMVASFDKPADYNLTDANEQMFWILVNKAESHYGLGEMEDFHNAMGRIKEVNPTEWMMKSFNDQHIMLKGLLTKYGNLLNPPWKE